jgi:hypothetical protein
MVGSMTRHPSQKRGRGSRALLWALAAVFACEGYEEDEDGTLEVVVRVEPAARRTASFPAEVLVGFDSSGAGFVLFRVGFLCAPPGESLALTARFAETAGGGPSTVDAWLVPVDSGTPAPCGALAAPERIASAPPRTAGVRTSAEIAVLAGCGSGEVRSGTLVFGG